MCLQSLQKHNRYCQCTLGYISPSILSPELNGHYSCSLFIQYKTDLTNYDLIIADSSQCVCV